MSRAKKTTRRHLKRQVKKRLRYFLDNTSLHGMKYLLRKPYWMEIVWMVIFSLLFLLMVTSISVAYFKYNTTLVGVSIDTNYLQWSNKFPAITICHRECNNFIYFISASANLKKKNIFRCEMGIFGKFFQGNLVLQQN